MSKSINTCILLALKYAHHEPVGGVPVKEARSELAAMESENAKIKHVLQMAVLSQGWDANDPDEDRWTEFYSAAKDALAMLEEAHGAGSVAVSANRDMMDM